MSWSGRIKNITGNTLSCSACFVSENSLILLHFTSAPKPIKIIFCVLLILLIAVSIYLNTSSIYFIWHELRRRTHVNLLLSSQSLADLLINLVVMLPIMILSASNTSARPSYHICLLLSFLDHWLHSITMLTMAEIIGDRYKVIVQRQLSTITRRTEKSMAVVTVIWVATFALSINYAAPFLRRTKWGSTERSCEELEKCDHSKNFFQWMEELINRIIPFTVILYCFIRMMWLTYRSRHRVGVKNSMANWKTVLVGIYAKSVNTCLLMMTLFLVATFPELAISVAVNLNKSINSDVLLLAAWLRFSLTVLKPAIYILQNGKKFSYCWFSICCRNVNVTKLVALAKGPSSSVAHYSNNDVGNMKVSFAKVHDLFAINLHIEEPEASVSSDATVKQIVGGETHCRNKNIIVKTI